MSHNHQSQPAIWTMATVLVSFVMVVNAFQSMFGKATFAYWHLVTLGLCFALASTEFSPAHRRLLRIHFRLYRKQAANDVRSLITRVARGLATLFIREETSLPKEGRKI